MATFNPIVSANEVFEFMGVADDQQSTHLNAIKDLLQQEQKELIRRLGRQIEAQTLTSFVLNEDEHFKFSNDYTKIMLIGEWRDLYNITSLTEAGTALTESTSYDDGNSFVFNKRLGVIERLNTSWSTSRFAIVISGSYGYVESDGSVKEDIKIILKQMVAMKSGLWKKTFISDGGDVSVSKDTPEKWFENIITGHKNISLI